MKNSWVSDLVVGLLLSTSFAICLTFVSTNHSSRFEHRRETIDQQLAILEGRDYSLGGNRLYFAVFQNRVLFPFLLKTASDVAPRLSVSQWYLVLRLLTAIVALLVFWLLLRRAAACPPKLAAAGLGMLAYTLIFTFNHGWEHPTDFPDVAFTAALIWAALLHRRWALVLIAIAMSFNRESSVFAGLIWFALYGLGPGLRPRAGEAAFSAGLCLATYALVTAIRLWFGGPRVLAESNLFWLATGAARFADQVAEAVRYVTPSSWPVLLAAMAAPLLAWLWSNREAIDDRTSRLLIATAATFVISVLAGQAAELRDATTSAVLLVASASILERARAARSLPAGNGT